MRAPKIPSPNFSPEQWADARDVFERAVALSGAKDVTIRTKGDVRNFLAAMVRIARTPDPLSTEARPHGK